MIQPVNGVSHSKALALTGTRQPVKPWITCNLERHAISWSKLFQFGENAVGDGWNACIGTGEEKGVSLFVFFADMTVRKERGKDLLRETSPSEMDQRREEAIACGQLGVVDAKQRVQLHSQPNPKARANNRLSNQRLPVELMPFPSFLQNRLAVAIG